MVKNELSKFVIENPTNNNNQNQTKYPWNPVLRQMWETTQKNLFEDAEAQMNHIFQQVQTDKKRSANGI